MSHVTHPASPDGPVPEGDAPAGALVGEPLARTIKRVAVPAVVANLLMTAFHNVDTFWIGRYLGADSLAAVTSAVFWIWLFISVGEMVSIGVDAVCARRHGERRPREAAQTVGEVAEAVPDGRKRGGERLALPSRFCLDDGYFSPKRKSILEPSLRVIW